MSRLEVDSRNYGWLIVVLTFVALALTFSARSSVGVLMTTWEEELGWARTLSSTGSSLVLAMMAIGSPLAGNLMDRYGPAYVLSGGLFFVGGAVFLTSFVSEDWQFLVIFGVVGGLGYGAVSLPLVSTAIALYFAANRGLATGIALSGATGGQLPVMTLLGVMVTTIGWRTTYELYGIVLLILAALTLLLVRRRTIRRDPAPEPGAVSAETLSFARKLAFLGRNRTFLLLFAGFTMCGFTTAGVIDVHFVPYAVSCGYTLVDSTAAYGVHGFVNVAGLILFAWMADHVHRPRLLAAMYFTRALTFVLLLYVSADISLLFIFAAIFGLINFATLPVIANIVATHVGVRIMGLTMGLIFGGHSLGGAAGAFLGGYLFDLFAKYDWVWIISLLLAFSAAFLSILIPETRDSRPVGRTAAA